MEIKYKIDKPDNFSKEDKDHFLSLLIKQKQVEKPNLKNINSCPFICIAYVDNVAIGIGAIKQIYKTPFDSAGVKELKDTFEFEIGYLFIDNESDSNNYRGFGIGKAITHLLLKKVEDQNVFATTELNINNRMMHILKSYGFESFGVPYRGKETNKLISLMLLSRAKTN